MKLGIKRLYRLADILDAADEKHIKREEMTYTQTSWGHPCGAPACALGHWAAAHPKRWKFNARRNSVPRYIRRSRGVEADAAVEFGLDLDHCGYNDRGYSSNEWDLLFSASGCGGALTGKQAARYIRRFAKRKEKELRSL